MDNNNFNPLRENLLQLLNKGIQTAKEIQTQIPPLPSSSEIYDMQCKFQLKNLPRFISRFMKKRHSSFTEEQKLIILIDMAGFSKTDNNQQVEAIYLFQGYLMRMKFISSHIQQKGIPIDCFIPTGDGCYIITKQPEPKIAIDFLTTLINGFYEIQREKPETEKIYLRVSALFGSCVPFMDLTLHRNYLGSGMNEASRILSCGQQIFENKLIGNGMSFEDSKMHSRNCLYVGDTLKQAVLQYGAEHNLSVDQFAQVSDKHNMKRNITILENI